MWRRLAGGVEHVRVAAVRDGVEVDGVVALHGDGDAGAARRLRYLLRCDAAWNVREVTLHAPEDGASLVLHADAEGRWREASPRLDGCIDVDLESVVFTNTLPIRRLSLPVGQSAVVDVAFVRLPSMSVVPVQQRYTRVAGDVYRYESLSSGFRADLRVDADGLVVDYPGLARRLWAA